MTTEDRPLLPVSSAGCTCCSPAPAEDRNPSPAVLAVSARTTTYAVEDMTCGHCVDTVRGAISAVEGVQDMQIDLQTGGVSTVTVTGSATREAIRAAMENTGYSLIAP